MPDDDLTRTALDLIERSKGLHHAGGVPWWEAPLPRRWHRCWAQTVGFADGYICRCACGAVSHGGGRWAGRNARRKLARSWRTGR
jgi:hypothetical protein